MSNAENEKAARPALALVVPCKWVLGKLASLMTGHSENALRKKVQDGIWLKGVHYTKGADGKLYYNWAEIDNWVEHGDQLPKASGE